MTAARLLALAALILGLVGLFPGAPAAQTLSLDLGEAQQDGTLAGTVVQLVGLLTVLSLAPSILIMMTCFTRIVIVLSFVRNAMGTQTTPPNQVLVSLALFLTFFIMAPTFEVAWEAGISPLIEGEIDEMEAFERSVAPLKAFMLDHTREQDLMLFASANREDLPEDPQAVPLQVLIPAFMISELKRAFEIGFLIFLPFLVIDMVVASILMSMGMMMLPPVIIALPFKIIFFVLVDGWYLIAGSLIASYTGGTLPGSG